MRPDTHCDSSAKSRAVRDMFGAIAGRYDFLNHFLSGNVDRRWRRACVSAVQGRASASEPRILDVGCGTGDLALEFSSLGPVVGCDFSRPMLRIGLKKTAGRRSGHPIDLLEGDALALPFPDGSFDIAVSAFVLRNLADPAQGLAEMRRVLKIGGVLGVLDFSMPRNPILGMVYRFYFLKILPRIGSLISGVRGPYSYLPDSVQAFAAPEELKGLIGRCGFGEVDVRLLTAGIAVLLVADVV